MPTDDLTMDERIARQLVEDDDRQARLMAEDYGRPPGTEPVSDAREVELWNERDVTFDEQKAWLEHLAAGTDLWEAKTDIAMRKFPNRLALIQAHRPKAKEQVAWGNRMAERARKAREQQPEPSAATAYTTEPPY